MIRLKPTTLAVAALVSAAFMLFGNVRQAEATVQLSIGNPGLEHFEADGGVRLDFGMTDANGAPVGNLKPDNIEVREDGKLAKILDFRGQGQGRPVDIVFVFDVTESMQPYIDSVKQNVIAFAQDLAANNRDYRLGLVTFEDYVVSKEPDCGCPYRTKMTGDVHEFITWVGSLHAGGGGDIPEDQLDALAYASSFAFRPEAQGILILITDAPNHHAGDGSAHTQHDQAYWDHHPNKNADVTDLTGDQVGAMLKKNGLTLYAVVPPPFIAPDYAQMVHTTHGRSYNIVTEEGRFDELVREIGHSIATEYSLTYRTPRPIEDGTERQVELKVTYNGETTTTHTSYQVRGVGGARINVPEDGAAGGDMSAGGTGLSQFSFQWWNVALPLIAIMALLGLSRAKFGVSAEELKAILEARSQPASPMPPSPVATGRAAPPPPSARPSTPAARAAAPGAVQRGARLVSVNPISPVAAEYAVLKDEVSLGRGEENDLVVPHASVSRAHARLLRRDGGYELTDLNSTNGTFVDNQPLHGSTMIGDGTEVRLGEITFVFQI